MARRTSLQERELQQLIHHRDYTAKDLIKWYTLGQLSFLDWIDVRTVKYSWKYLPVRVDDSGAIDKYKRGLGRRPYRVLYIRLDEIKYIFNKKTGKNLVVEYN